jgi:hypothetical protein
MYSSRKSSVKRHIQNIHGGNANFVSFVDYLAGRKLGIYWPVLPATYQKNNKKSTDYMSIMSEEVWRELIKQKVGMPNSNLFQKFFGGSI